jgi:shikimate dehydrogenase
MIKAGVIGYPLSHTLSPQIHNYWLQQNNIDGEYLAHEIHPDDLKTKLFALRDAGYRGVNVTLPHKENITKFCTTLTRDAAIIGAVNTVIFHDNGEIEGHNNDAYGFITHARQTVPNLNINRAMVLGAGGAARAILFALKQAGAHEIFITNRSLERAENLAEEFGARVVEWHDKDNYVGHVDFLVNTTSCGMAGQPPLDISLNGASPNLIVYDIVYKPLMTNLLRTALDKNLQIITGLGMLLHQAAPAFQSFYGRNVVVDSALETMILNGLQS